MTHPIDPQQPAKGQDWNYRSAHRTDRSSSIVLDVHTFAGETSVVYLYAGRVYASSLGSFLEQHDDPRWGAPLTEECYFVNKLTPQGVQPDGRFADPDAAWAFIDQANHPNHVGVSKATITYEVIPDPRQKAAAVELFDDGVVSIDEARAATSISSGYDGPFDNGDQPNGSTDDDRELVDGGVIVEPF